jgi:hypothetical protein
MMLSCVIEMIDMAFVDLLTRWEVKKDEQQRSREKAQDRYKKDDRKRGVKVS